MQATKNNITLEGTVFSFKKYNTNSGKIFTTFNLGFYNGKDENGKTKYAFVNIVAFKNVDLEDKSKIIVSGRLTEKSYINKEQKEVKSFEIVADNLETPTVNFPLEDKKPQEILSDDIPF